MHTTTLLRISGSIITAFALYKFGNSIVKKEQLSGVEGTLVGGALLSGAFMLGIGFSK